MTISAERTRTPVTRAEIAAAVSDLFGSEPIGREDLLAGAARSGARAEVIEALSLLPPAKRYASLRQIWPSLPEMAVR